MGRKWPKLHHQFTGISKTLRNFIGVNKVAESCCLAVLDSLSRVSLMFIISHEINFTKFFFHLLRERSCFNQLCENNGAGIPLGSKKPTSNLADAVSKAPKNA